MMSYQCLRRRYFQDDAVDGENSSMHVYGANDVTVLPLNPLVVDNRGAFITSERSRKESKLTRLPLSLRRVLRKQKQTILTCLLAFAALKLAGAQDTAMPSGSPTTTPGPTQTAAPTDTPSHQPSPHPTVTFSPSTSPAPSHPPSFSPTLFPTNLPSISPTNFPTTTFRPSFSPSSSPEPSVSPTDSPMPSSSPSSFPTISAMPSASPSASPSAEATFPNVQISRGKFTQRFDMRNVRPLNVTEEMWFEEVVQNYTEFITDEDRINTTADISNSAVVETRRRLLRRGEKYTWTDSVKRILFSTLLRGLQDGEVLVEVEYTMTYTSFHRNVSELPTEFRSYVNEDLDRFENDLNDAGLDVRTAFRAELVLIEASDPPSFSPTEVPSFPPSIPPSQLPSASPTNFPTMEPSWAPSGFPTAEPTFVPSVAPPSSGSGVNSTVIAVVVVLSSAAVLIALFLYYRRRQRQKEMDFQAQAAGGGNRRYVTSQASEAPPQENASTVEQQSTVMASNRTAETDMITPHGSTVATGNFDGRESYLKNAAQYEPNAVAGMISPTDSLLSQPSLISVGEYNGGESGDEADDTHHLADEFDQYKDKNLEKMRTEVEGNLSNFDGMMSQALTKALMDDDDSPNPKELLWGGQGDSMEIEASALWEVTGWLKRKEGASLDERRIFMQETLNKMVASVRHGVIGPEHASRAIHECGAILGLELADDFPEDTLMVTGMRKTVRRENVIEAFEEFGEIDDAAVSANNRGFGLVRFKSTKSVDLAMDRVRTEEIVVQDVAVMCKVVKPEGSASRSVTPSWHQPGFPAPSSEMDRQYSGPASMDVDRSYAAPPPEQTRAASAPVTRQTSREVNGERFNGEGGDQKEELEP